MRGVYTGPTAVAGTRAGRARGGRPLTSRAGERKARGKVAGIFIWLGGLVQGIVLELPGSTGVKTHLGAEIAHAGGGLEVAVVLVGLGRIRRTGVVMEVVHGGREIIDRGESSRTVEGRGIFAVRVGWADEGAGGALI